MSDIVIVISCNEDGDKSIDRMRKEEFLARLKRDCYGSKPVFQPAGTVPNLDCFSGLIVIEGDVIVPKAVQRVTEYEI